MEFNQSNIEDLAHNETIAGSKVVYGIASCDLSGRAGRTTPMVAEIIGGNLYTHPRPAPPHAIASSRLGNRLGPPFDFGDSGPGGWWTIDKPELHLGDDILVPDIAGWRRERMPDAPTTAYFTQVPDWVCEVLSPST